MHEAIDQGKLWSGLSWKPSSSLLSSCLPLKVIPVYCGRCPYRTHSHVSSLCRYRLAGLPGEHQQRNISSPEVNYCLVTDLIIWTQYEIQVAAYNGAGLGVFSRAVTEYTLQGGELQRGGGTVGNWELGSCNSLGECLQNHRSYLGMGKSSFLSEPNLNGHRQRIQMYVAPKDMLRCGRNKDGRK